MSPSAARDPRARGHLSGGPSHALRPFRCTHAVTSTPPNRALRLLSLFSSGQTLWNRAHWPSPVTWQGRHSVLKFRSLNGLHFRYGLTACRRTLIRRLSPDASPVIFRKQPGVRIATRPKQPGPGRDLHPLEKCASVAHHVPLISRTVRLRGSARRVARHRRNGHIGAARSMGRTQSPGISALLARSIQRRRTRAVT